MKFTDDLKKKINKIEISKIEDFLIFNNWIQYSVIEDKAKVWHRSESEFDEYELLLPLTKYFKDYQERIEELIITLSNFHKKNIIDIINQIDLQIIDKIKIQVKYEDVNDGTIPITDGLKLFNNVKELLISAALATFKKRKYFSNYRPNEINEYIDSLKLGQTEVGSYVVNVYSPIQLQANQLFESETYSRKVIKLLSQSLKSLKNASDNYKINKKVEIFDNSIDNGVSANLCDAIAEISGERRKRDINFEISYLSLKNEKKVEKIEIKSNEMEIIETASEYFKQDVLLENHSIVGYVTKLIRDENHNEGNIILKCKINNINKNVKISLNEQDYELAIEAHEKQLELECIGNLHLKIRSSILLDVISVKLLNDNEDNSQNLLF